jgi:hypothetical protein
VEWAALGLSVCCLLAQIWLLRRSVVKDDQQSQQEVGFSVFKPAKASKKPRVRDELAAWRAEQEEKHEWEASLRQKENQR